MTSQKCDTPDCNDPTSSASRRWIPKVCSHMQNRRCPGLLAQSGTMKNFFVVLVICMFLLGPQLATALHAPKQLSLRETGGILRPNELSVARDLPRAASNGFTRKVDPCIQDLIRRLPKAELHIHIEGTIEPELMWALALRNNVTLPYPNLAAAKAARQHFNNLQDFLDAFHIGQSVLLHQQDFYDVTEAYLNRAAEQNITHVELFYDAQEHVARGVPLSAVVNGMQGAIDARKNHPTYPIDGHLILCLQRDRGELSAAKILAMSLPYMNDIMGLGLASTEVGYPPQNFKEVYKAASLLGLHKVAHAGEEAGPDYIWDSLRVLGAERIDHGIHSLDDPALVQYMAQHKVPITLCPLSNLRLQVYKGSLPEKIREILSCGIIVTINSDDPAYFGGYLNANYEYAAAVANLSADEIAALARNSFAASFISAGRKAEAYAQIDKVLAGWKTEQQQQQHQ